MHGAVASRNLAPELVVAVLSDGWREADLAPGLRGTLGWLEQLTLRPADLDARAAAPALAAGVPVRGLETAGLIGVVFSVMNRLVDAFGADISPELVPRSGLGLDMASRVMARKNRGAEAEPYAGRLPDAAQELLRSIREGDGDAPATVRAAAEARVAVTTGAVRPEQTPLPPEVGRYVDALGRSGLEVSDNHIAHLKEAGWSEEAIYELTFIAAAGAALGRLEQAWQVLAGLQQ